MSKLRELRKAAGLNQAHVAAKLRISQSLVSMLEGGRISLSDDLAPGFARLYSVEVGQLREFGRSDASRLKLSESPAAAVAMASVDADALIQSLAALGYPEFKQSGKKYSADPSSLLLTALRQPVLARNVAEALPWVALSYEVEISDILIRARIHDLQNRLGYVLTLARKVAERQKDFIGRRKALSEMRMNLLPARLAREDSLCLGQAGSEEQEAARNSRPDFAVFWNMLDDFTPEDLPFISGNHQ